MIRIVTLICMCALLLRSQDKAVNRVYRKVETPGIIVQQ